MNCLHTFAVCARSLVTITLLGAQFALAQNTCPMLGIGDDVPASPTSMKLWDINTGTAVASNPRTVQAAPNRAPTTIACSPTGIVYGVSQGSPGDTPPGARLFTINTVTGATTVVGILTILLTVEGDIAIDPTTDVLYAVTGIGDLFTINTSNAQCTLVGNLPLDQNGGADYSGLAFTSQGRLFVWSTFGPVVREVDKTNGNILSTATLVPLPGGQIGGMAFEPSSGVCYVGGGVGNGAALATCNTTTGVVLPIGPLTPMSGMWAMTFDFRNCARVSSQGTGCTSLTGLLPLTLQPIGRPIQGPTAVNFDAVTTNIESTALMHLGILGIARPGIPLSIFGLPTDCFLWASVDVIVGPQLFPGSSQNWTVLNLPALPPSFSGFAFNCQAATFDSNGLGPTTRVSNGLKCVVGTL